MRIFTGLFILFLLNLNIAFGTSVRYWVNGSGFWNNPNNWSVESGGAGGASIPTAKDNVIFDENSFGQKGETVTISGLAECRNLIWLTTEKTPVLRGNKSSLLRVHGTFIVDDAILNKFQGNLIFTSESSDNIFYMSILIRN